MTESATLDVTLPRVLAERASETPDRVWVRDAAGRSLTYVETLTETQRWATAYRRLGLDHGEHVVTMQFNTIDSVIGWLGMSWLGAVEAPINIDYRGDLLVHALNITRARVMGLRAEFVPRVAEVADRLENLKQLVVLDSAAPPAGAPFEVTTIAALLDGAEPATDLKAPAPWDIGAILFTSGTTGPSKAVRLPWGQIHVLATGTFPLEDLGPDDVMYNPGPTYHVGAKLFPFMAALVGGSHFMRRWISSQMADDMLTHGITTGGPPMGWMREPERPDDAQRPMRNLIISQKVPGLDEFKARFGARSWSCFAMTEVPVPITSPAWDTHRFDANGIMACGKVRQGYPGFEVRIVDEHDQPVGAGEVGELIVRTAVPWTMNAGYLNNPEATAQAWRNGWFHTGDGMRFDEDGWYYFVDRLKDAIRRRGENISSFEVESFVGAHPAIAGCAAIAAKRSDEPGVNEEVKVVCVLEPDTELDPADLIKWLVHRMPRFMIPRYVEFVPSLPRTATGKVRKLELRDSALNDNTWDREAAGIVVPR